MHLAIDTCTKAASVALADGERTLAELTWHSRNNHTLELWPSITFVLERGHVSLEDIRAVIVAKGPGSFSGIRVGMSAAKGLALSLEIPIVGVSTLEAMAYQFALSGLPICPLLELGRGEVAAALYRRKDGDWLRLREEHITTPQELAYKIRTRTILCGEMSPATISILQEKSGNKTLIAKETAHLRRASFLAELGGLRLQRGDVDDLDTLQPLYLRRPSITMSAKISVLGQKAPK